MRYCIDTMAVPKVTAKAQVMELVSSQPEDASYEDFIKEICFLRKVERGLEDSRAGRAISDEEMGKQIETWFA